MCIQQFQKWTQDLLFLRVSLPLSSQGFADDKKKKKPPS